MEIKCQTNKSLFVNALQIFRFYDRKDILQMLIKFWTPQIELSHYYDNLSHGPVIASVSPFPWILTKSVLPDGEKTTPANSESEPRL